MRVMVFVKATEDSERGLPPATDMREMFEEMGKFNDELIKAGIMKDGDGLKPSSHGKRIAFDGKSRTVKDGADAWTAAELGTASYLQAADGVKKKTGIAKRVDLTMKDVTYDVWDASFALSFDGDLRGLELGNHFSV